MKPLMFREEKQVAEPCHWGEKRGTGETPNDKRMIRIRLQLVCRVSNYLSNKKGVENRVGEKRKRESKRVVRRRTSTKRKELC